MVFGPSVQGAAYQVPYLDISTECNSNAAELGSLDAVCSPAAYEMSVRSIREGKVISGGGGGSGGATMRIRIFNLIAMSDEQTFAHSQILRISKSDIYSPSPTDKDILFASS
jgi:hypothetical protein